MIAVARTADVVIMMLDATKGEIQKYVLYCLYCSVMICDLGWGNCVSYWNY